ncbi:MAG: ribonuclease Z [Clostridium sp.]|nr:ribonuclease Z [Clostridium sp.]
MIDVCLLGSGGSMPTPGRSLTSMLLSFNGKKILVDCGEGTQVSMKIMGTGFKKIDVICLTHYHADHVLGLPGLLLTIANSGRTEPLTIMGPIGLTTVIKGLLVIAPFLPYDLNLMEIKENSTKIDFGDIIINATLNDHSVPCMGYNFITIRKRKFDIEKAKENNVPKNFWNKLQHGENISENGICFTPDMVLGDRRSGIKISYVTDTRPTDNLVDFISTSDLFICEGMYGENEDIEKALKNKHMIFREAAKLAKGGQVKELWLTHFSPSLTQPKLYLNNAKEVFSNVKIGEDRLCKSFNYKDFTE